TQTQISSLQAEEGIRYRNVTVVSDVCSSDLKFFVIADKLKEKNKEFVGKNQKSQRKSRAPVQSRGAAIMVQRSRKAPAIRQRSRSEERRVGKEGRARG